MQPRTLAFASYDDLIAEIRRCQRDGYERLGQWSLGQTCAHLSYYLRGTLEGFGVRLPWIIRKTFGRLLLRRLLAGGEFPRGGRTIPASLPPDALDETAAIEQALTLLGRLKAARADLHPSPLFDRLTPAQWQTLHLRHAAHHLRLLVPRSDVDHAQAETA